MEAYNAAGIKIQQSHNFQQSGGGGGFPDAQVKLQFHQNEVLLILLITEKHLTCSGRLKFRKIAYQVRSKLTFDVLNNTLQKNNYKKQL